MTAEIESIDVRQNVRLVFAGNLTMAVLTVAGESDLRQPLGLGIALCHPQDTYDKELGADLAITRAYADWGKDAQAVLGEGIDRRCKRLKEVTRLREEARARAEQIKDMSAEQVLEATLERKPPKPRDKAPEERDALDLLIVGRQLIQNPKHWIQGRSFLAARYRPEDCIGMCASGAVSYAGGMIRLDGYPADFGADGEQVARARRWLDKAAQKLSRWHFVSVTGFNDDPRTEHSDVMRLFNAAIAMAREAESA